MRVKSLLIKSAATEACEAGGWGLPADKTGSNNFLSVAQNTAPESSRRMEATGQNVKGTGDSPAGTGDVGEDCMVCLCLLTFSTLHIFLVKYPNYFLWILSSFILHHKNYCEANSKAVSHTAHHAVVFMSFYSAKPQSSMSALAWLITRYMLHACL